MSSFMHNATRKTRPATKMKQNTNFVMFGVAGRVKMVSGIELHNSFFFSLSLSTILKECKFRRDAFLFLQILQKNNTKITAVGFVVFFFTIIAHVCAIKQLEMRSNLIVPVLQFINIIPWPSIPVLPMEDWISGWLWNYRNHCITVFCSVFFISNGLISCYFTV